jgi:hypothetical protein
MPDYGWAYVNLDVLKTIEGPTGSIQIKTDGFTLSGSQYLSFATASNKVGIGLDFPTTMPTHQLHVKAKAGESAAANFTGDILVSGSAFISGTLKVENLEANTVISSSHLIVNDSVIGLGFGDTAGQTGSVGDRGFVFGLAGNLNQAIIWDQTSGSFVMGKVGAQGPEKDNFDITTADLGELRLGQISSSVGVSSSLGEFQNLRIGGATVTSVVDVSGTPANNQVAIWTDGNTIEGDSKLTFDGTTLKILGPISGSGDLDIVGAAVIEGALSVSGSSTLGDAASDITKIVGHLSSSADAKIAGTTTIAASLNVSGSSILGGAATTVTKVVGHLSASSDAKIAGTTTIGAALNVSGSSTLGGADTTVTKVVGHLSASSDVKIAGTTTIAAALNVSGSSTLGGAVTDSTSIIGHLSASTDVKVAGTAIVAGALNVSGTTALNNTVSVASKIEHIGDTDTHLKFDTDKIELIAGNEALLTLTEDTQDIVTVGDGGDVDFQVKTGASTHTIFAEGSSDRVGIRATVPQAVFHISGSGHYGVKEEDLFRIDADAGQGILFVSGSGEVGIGTTAPGSTLEISGSGLGMASPVFTILHPGAETGGVSDGKPLIMVTGSTPDGFEGRLGINTDDPKASLHVAGAGNTSLLATSEGKVLVGGDYTAAASFTVRSGLSSGQIAEFQNNRLNPDDGKHGPFNIFFVSGSSDGGGYFGSHHSGSHLHVSGTSMLSSVRVHYSSSETHPLSVTAQPQDYVFAFKTDVGAYTLVLESAAVAGVGRKIVIKDSGNNASSNNITITGSQKIDLIEFGASTTIDNNKGSKTLVSDGVSRWWVIAKN